MGFMSVSAQKHVNKAKVAKPAAVAVTPSPGQKLFNEMLDATAKVMFIDSVVVDKGDFLAKVPLNPESGTLAVTNPKAHFSEQLASFQNEFGDRRIVANGDTSKTRLYTQTLLGDKWSKAAVITDFDEADYKMQNYPFLATDGVTLFFAAKGPESVGGYDIFMSTFDSDNARWYKPQNYGLPFNSTANDYLIAIDDLDTLGWLATDRMQPEGKVCIYTFVPTETRQNFDNDDLDDSELKAFAEIKSIKDTWKFGNRKAALRRRDAMLARLTTKVKTAGNISFVVDDNTIVTSPSQFRSDESRALYKQVVEIGNMLASTQKNLEDNRKRYHDGDHSVAQAILKAEQELTQQRTDLKTLEKKIRLIETKK